MTNIQLLDLRLRLAAANSELDELTEMLTAATDMAVQRGKRIDAAQAVLNNLHHWEALEMSDLVGDIREALDGV